MTKAKKNNKPKGGNAPPKRRVNNTNKNNKTKQPGFGPIASINTAPVAIGNSLRGSRAEIVHTKNGPRVVGRDFGFAGIATGTVTGWAFCGGMPLTPCCMPTTILRNYVQMYGKFKFVSLQAHYITSSPTSTSGDIIFYFNKNPGSQLPEWTNNSFLPFVLTDPGTVLGPQWTNHSISMEPMSDWLSTDYGVENEAQHLYSAGDLVLFSKTSSTESPGYVILDYVIDFCELQSNPRAGLLPLAKAQWQPVALTNGVVATADVSNVSLGGTSTSFIGSTTITAPTYTVGDVYMFVMDVTNSTYGAGSSASTAWSYKPISTVTVVTPKDGIIFYLLVDSSSTIRIYAVLSNALGDSHGLLCHQSITYADTYRGYIKYVTSVDASTTNRQSY